MSLKNKIIDYAQYEKEINHRVLLKGEYRYQDIIDFLKKQNISCTWENVTCYIKYDKRILINSFKYIVFLEELYKAFIVKSFEITRKDALNLSFSGALNKFLSKDNISNYDEMDIETLAKEKDSIIKFRNCVVHNKILLIQNFKGKTLKEILNIFTKILPKSYKAGFIKDINNCSKDITENLWHIEI